MRQNVKIVLDSIVNDVRVTTFELTIYRPTLPQINTHRVFSRNAASSRAMPASRVRELSSFTPEVWRKNGKGMSPKETFNTVQSYALDLVWDFFRAGAIIESFILSNVFGVHKEQANRLLEPFQFTKVLVTSTEWDNFLHQRLDSHAQYEIRQIAQQIDILLKTNTPIERDFHFPYITDEEWGESRAKIKVGGSVDSEVIRRIMSSVARCARVSYLNFDGKNSFEKDRATFAKLVLSSPPHLSPAEHQVMNPITVFHSLVFNQDGNIDESETYSGNMDRRVIQFRKLLELPFIMETVKKAAS